MTTTKALELATYKRFITNPLTDEEELTLSKELSYALNKALEDIGPEAYKIMANVLDHVRKMESI